MRLVLDTAVIVAALRSPDGASRLWLESILMKRDKLLLSVPLVLEYESVLKRPEQRATTRLTLQDTEALIDGLCAVCVEVDLVYLWRPMLRDPDDEMVIETAVMGRADALLTFNVKDFAGADRLGIPVLRPGEAWAKWRR